MVSSTIEQPLPQRWFSAASLAVGGYLVTETPWSAGPSNRMLVAGVTVAWLALFFPKTKDSRIVAAAVALMTLFAAASSAPGISLVLFFSALVIALTPAERERKARPLGYGLATLATYAVVLALGELLLLDHGYGRMLPRRLAGLPFLSSAGGEIPSLTALFGPWLWLWSLLILLGFVWNEPKEGSRIHLGSKTALTWLAPVGAALAIGSPWVLAVACIAIAERIVEPVRVPKAISAPRQYWGLAGLTAAAAVTVLLSSWGSNAAPPRVIALAKIGLGSVEPKRNAPHEPTRKYEADFGRLAAFLTHQGYRVVQLDKNWSEKDLEGVDTALFINQTTLPTQGQVDALYQRVDQGMRLVVVGDHTDIMGVRAPANRLLSRVPLRLEFDSAIPFLDHHGWFAAQWSESRFAGTTDYGRSPQFSVGASVSAAPIARPLLVGMYGFADRGDTSKSPGFLGNMNYDRGEPVFGIPLAVEVSFGRGTVAAFGDTSTFQDTAINESARFLIRSLGQPRLSPAALVSAGWVSTLLVAVVLSLAAGKSRWFGGIGFVLGLAFWIADTLPASQGGEIKVDRAFVYDRTLRPRYPAEPADEKTDQLTELALRHGRQILDAGIREAVEQKASCIIVNAPTKKPSEQEIELLRSFVRGGGNLFVLSGRKSWPITKSLLQAFGVEIDPTPLGGQGTTEVVPDGLRERILKEMPITGLGRGGTMIDACEIRGRGEVLARTMGKPTAMLIREGAGRLAVIGDDTIGTSKNLGKELNVNLDACRFLYEVLGFVKERGH